MANITTIINSNVIGSPINNISAENIDFDKILTELDQVKKYMQNNDKYTQGIIQEAIEASKRKERGLLLKAIKKFTKPIINCINELSLNVLSNIITDALP